MELFHRIDASRLFNVLDSIIIEEGMRNGETDDAMEKARITVDKVYNSTETSTSPYREDSRTEYYGERSDPSGAVKPYLKKNEPTEDGYPGLLPPMN